MNEKLIGQVDESQIARWKKEHGKVFALKVDGRVAYLKRPDRKTLGFASVTSKNDPMKFNEAVLNNCWLGGDEEIMTDDVLFVSASQVLGDIIQIKEAELEEL